MPPMDIALSLALTHARARGLAASLYSKQLNLGRVLEDPYKELATWPGVKSSQVESSRVKSSQVESSRVKSSQVESSRVKSSQVDASRRESTRVESGLTEWSSRTSRSDAAKMGSSHQHRSEAMFRGRPEASTCHETSRSVVFQVR